MKPQNILIVRDGAEQGKVKIADFGLARVFQNPLKSLIDVEKVVVTLWYRAPELLLGAKHYSKAVDIWAIGCIFAEMMNLKELFRGKENTERGAPFQRDQCDTIFRLLGVPSDDTWKNVSQLPEYRNEVHKWREEKTYPKTSMLQTLMCSRENLALYNLKPESAAFDLLQRMLILDPENRISARDALNHRYFSELPKLEERNCFLQSDGGSIKMTDYPLRIKADAPPPQSASLISTTAKENNNNGASGVGVKRKAEGLSSQEDGRGSKREKY